MRRLIGILALFTALISIPFSIVFAEGFEKIESNPLRIDFHNVYRDPLQFHIFKRGAGYEGVVSVIKDNNPNRILVKIESEDGYLWEIKKEIIEMNYELTNPRLFREGSFNRLIFSATTGQDVYELYQADCDDELNCGNIRNFFKRPNISDLNERHGYFAPYIYKQDNQYYLAYGVWGDNGFKIRLSYSNDLENWTDCPHFSVDGADGPFLILRNNLIQIYFHTPNSTGIRSMESASPLTCESVFSNDNYVLKKSIDSDINHMIYPSLIEEDTEIKMYYSGLDRVSKWQLNLATYIFDTSGNQNIVKKPIVIIPGFMSSWNKDAILHNRDVAWSDWKIAKFVHEYDGLINTLKNIGYREGIDLFLFEYDWRKSIKDILHDFDEFLSVNKILKNGSIDIVGHSFGGLIGRIFTQENYEAVNKIISVGSPHLGAVQFYKPVEAGEIDRENTLIWLAQKLILLLNKSKIESDRITIQKKFPSLKDMFPTFTFLKNRENVDIPLDSLVVRNEYLSSYNMNIDYIFPKFTALYGEKDMNTLSGYVIEQRSVIDEIIGNYPDGRPVDNLLGPGDYTVLSKSASQDVDAVKYYFDHSEIITKKEALKSILDVLGIDYQENQIEEGAPTKVTPSLIFLMRSPAEMSVEYNNSIVSEEDGIIFLQDAKTDAYTLKVRGKDLGKYQLIVWQITETDDLWEEIDGEIKTIEPNSQVDEYRIEFNRNKSKPLRNTPTPSLTPTGEPTIVPSPTKTLEPVTPSPTPIREQNKIVEKSDSNNSKEDKSETQINPSPTKQAQDKDYLLAKDESESSTYPSILGKSVKRKDEVKADTFWIVRVRRMLLGVAIIILIIFILLLAKKYRLRA